MAYPLPKIIGHGAEQMKLLAYVELPVDQRVTASWSLAGPGPRDVCGFAMCHDRVDNSIYLFSCDADWRVMFDTNHDDFDEAKRQAEFQCPGIGEQLKVI